MIITEITNVNELPDCEHLLWFAASDEHIAEKLADYGVTERVAYRLKSQVWVPVGVVQAVV